MPYIHAAALLYCFSVSKAHASSKCNSICPSHPACSSAQEHTWSVPSASQLCAMLQAWTSSALAAILPQQQGCSVEHVGHFVHREQHDPIGREGSQQAWREAFVEPSGTALCPQLLQQRTDVLAQPGHKVHCLTTKVHSIPVCQYTLSGTAATHPPVTGGHAVANLARFLLERSRTSSGEPYLSCNNHGGVLALRDDDAVGGHG